MKTTLRDGAYFFLGNGLIQAAVSKHALGLYSKPSATARQMDICLRMIRKPGADAGRFSSVWLESVYALRDAYEMKP